LFLFCFVFHLRISSGACVLNIHNHDAHAGDHTKFEN